MNSCTVFLLIALAGLAACSSGPEKTREDLLQMNVTDLRDTLQITVKDPARLSQMLTIVDTESAQLQADAVAFENLRKQQRSLDTDYNATRDEFVQVGEQIQAVRQLIFGRIIKMRNAVAQLATDDEWKKITARDLGIINN